jgi:sulfur carrier protein
MKIKINSKEQEYSKNNITVSEILTNEDVKNPELVSVQLNGEFVNREDYNDKVIKDGDELDYLFFMGGGSYNKKTQV